MTGPMFPSAETHLAVSLSGVDGAARVLRARAHVVRICFTSMMYSGVSDKGKSYVLLFVRKEVRM